MFADGVRLLDAGNAAAALQEFQAALARASTSGQKADTHYNIAICHLRLGHELAALEAIARAVAVDEAVASEIRNDPDFAALRSHASFHDVTPARTDRVSRPLPSVEAIADVPQTGSLGILLEPLASGTFGSRLGALAKVPIVFGILAIALGLLSIWSGTRDDREKGLFLTTWGGALFAAGCGIGWLMKRHDAKHANDPRPLQGVVFSRGAPVWAQYSARLGSPTSNGAVELSDLRMSETSSPPPGRPMIRLRVAPVGASVKDFHLVGFDLIANERLIGEATSKDRGVFYLLDGDVATPLYAATLADGDLSRNCVRNLRRIGEILSRLRPHLDVRLTIGYPKEGIALGLAFGLAGGLVSAGLDHMAKNKLQRLIDTGRLRDLDGNLQDLAASFGWEIELA